MSLHLLVVPRKLKFFLKLNKRMFALIRSVTNKNLYGDFKEAGF